jgi:recombination protein RecT
MNEVATTKKNPLVDFKVNLGRLHKKGELALPKTIPFEAFQNALIVAVTDNPQILNCSNASLFKAVRTLAGAGLIPDGREAAIVPFKGEAQAMPMVYGLIKTARNSGKITSLWADVVYDGETIEIWIEDGERKWNHCTNDGSKIDAMSRGGQIRGAYAVAKMTDGTVDFQPMSREEIEKRRRASANQKDPNNPSGIWEKWYDEMAKKTVIRNLCKRLPMSSDDIERMMAEQDPPAMLDVTPQETPQEARPNLAQSINEDAPQDKPVTGEILDPEPDEDTETKTGAEPNKEAAEYLAGVKAAADGFSLNDCPHPMGFDQWLDWAGGWNAGKGAD